MRMQHTDRYRGKTATNDHKKKQQHIGLRGGQVLELSSKGHSLSEIATMLQLDKSIICRDIYLMMSLSAALTPAKYPGQ
jgi:hypothetical protein